MEIKILTLILIGVVILVSVMLFWNEYAAMKAKVTDIEKRLSVLEVSQNNGCPTPPWMPYSTPEPP